MAAQNAIPSDLYKCVYSFLLENKFTKAAQQFLKQTKVVSGSVGVAVKPNGRSVGVVKLLRPQHVASATCVERTAARC